MGPLPTDVRSLDGWRLMGKKSTSVREEINGEDVSWGEFAWKEQKEICLDRVCLFIISKLSRL